MQWFRDRLTATKLLLGFGLVIAMLIAVAAAGVQGMQRMDTAMDVLYENHAMGLNQVKDANVFLIKSSRAVRNAILDDNEADIRQRMSDLVRYREGFTATISGYEKTLLLQANRDKTAALRRRFEELGPKQDRVVGLALAGKDAEAKAGLKEIRAMADQVESALDEQEAGKLALMQKSAGEAQQTYEAARTAMLATTVGALVLALVLAMTLGRIIANPLKEAATVLGRVAEGDFTVRLDTHSKDEVGQMAASLNRAVEDMRSALTEIRSRSGEVSEAAENLASASEELSSGAQEQASSLEETSASLEEITATVKQNADSARQANQLAAGSREAAGQGSQVVGSAVAAMGEINHASKRIADIITTIDEIAFQTNLLALNAAVEAARAGEQGRGFAVVAAEVRNLAQRSATAAKEIKTLIQDSVRKVESGTELVNKSGTTLDEIVTSVKRVTDIVSEIAAASGEQATGIDQVAKAMTQMDKVTQANAAQTEELSATAQTLNEQSARMQELISKFRLGEEGAAYRSRPREKAKAPAAAVRRGKPTSARSLAALHAATPAESVTSLKPVTVGEDGFEEY